MTFPGKVCISRVREEGKRQERGGGEGGARAELQGCLASAFDARK